MRVIAFIEDLDVIKKNLQAPGPVGCATPIDAFLAYDEQPGLSSDDYIRDPDYPIEAYFF